MLRLKSQRLISILSLFFSSGTLVCCAIPAALVSIGAGASLAGLVSAFPQIVWFSEHKLTVFIISGVLILVSLSATWVNRNAPCPIDSKVADACQRLRKWSTRFLAVAVFLYIVGASFAFIIPALNG